MKLYESDRAIVYLDDCRSILPDLPPADLVVFDPPYGVGYRSGFSSNHDLITGDEDVSLALDSLRLLNVRDYRHIYMFWSPKVARPDATVIVLVGDGTLGFHLAEFETALRIGAPVILVVGNDAC